MNTFIRTRILQKYWQACAIQVFGDNPYPTFHEIKSPGVTMYRDQGLDAQKLAGHTTEAMTDQYDQAVRYEEAGTL